jgi:arsenite methyltransferase
MFLAADWDAVVWHSEIPDRMALVLKSWETHCAHPRLPRLLAGRLVRAGFQLDRAWVFPILNLQWDDEPSVWQVLSGVSLAARMSFRAQT